jgi:hypothetical protein
MRSRLLLILVLGSGIAGGEILDRIAATVDRIVISESDMMAHLRVSAFLSGEPLDVSAQAKRNAAKRLVEQALIRREMEIARYTPPSSAEIEAVLQEIKSKRFPEADGYRRTLAEYNLDEGDLRESLLLQATLLRFIEFRFRPSVAVSDEEVEQYYSEKVAKSTQGSSAVAPSLEDSREEIEEILISQRVNTLLDGWLTEAARQARIRLREEVFQ